MLIRKLNLVGFKSFVEPSTLFIEPGLTGVVGPNGCGKSNLLEALRWVMGETSPRQMRSGGMEDVIFAGTTRRPPREFAEVALHAKDEAGEELVIARRIERGAGTAYRVNGQDVRARDVALLFADAATGAHSPALVSQGRIAAVIAARPAERRQMLEEAAGIAGLHVRRRDAESRLRQAEGNLSRLQDIIGGLEARIGGLGRQARQAERYRELTRSIETAQARLLFAGWREAAEAAEAAHDKARSAQEAVARAKSASQTARETRDRCAAHQATTADALIARREDETAQGHAISNLSNRLEAAEQRLADHLRQAERLDQERNEVDALMAQAARAVHELEAGLAECEASLSQHETDRAVLVIDADKAEQSTRAAELALANASAASTQLEAEWRIAQGAVDQSNERLAQLARDGDRLAAQASALDVGDIDEAVEAAKAQAHAAGGNLARARDELVELQRKKTELGEARDAATAELSIAKAELAGTEREWLALSRDKAARAKAAGYEGELPNLIDRVTAEPGCERALAAVLGSSAHGFLGLPAKDLEGHFWTGTNARPPVPDSLRKKMVDCPPELDARLALVHFAEADDGRDLPPGEWLVTRAGRLRRWDGLVTQGSGLAEAALLEAGNRYRTLDARLPLERRAVADAERNDAAARAKFSDIQQKLAAAEQSVASRSDEERAAMRALDRSENSREQTGRQRAVLAEALAEFGRRKAEAELIQSKVCSQRATLPDREETNTVLQSARREHDDARLALQSSAAALSARDQALAGLRERAASKQADMRGWQARSGDAARRLAEIERTTAEIGGQRAQLSLEPGTLRRQIAERSEARDAGAQALIRAQREAERANAALEAAETGLAAANEAVVELRELRAGLAVEAESADIGRQELVRQSGERFGVAPPALPDASAFDAAQVGNTHAEASASDKLHRAREAIGPVNLVAADELARCETERDGHAHELADIAEAVRRLRGSIGRLNREGRERLLAAFEAVNGHFERLFTRLFDGGNAYLKLIDSDDPLEAGLEIFAQPPEKRLQSLTLLSGGEQALTAIALIFALFLTNPAPVCVLDEVDAPLDDANVDRFCDLLDAMGAQTATRYLIVTHNSVTMSRMHRLFGVTMVEKGVSQLVSVDLGVAEDILAAAQ